MSAAGRREALAAALVAALAFLPFLRGAVSGASLYFRDLALYFLPLRRLALEGLRSGEVRFWNPYLHEGVPLSLPALGYPLDLLQLLRPDEAGISLLLALHVPLAALGFYALARGLLAASPPAAAGGALVYALGGFVLSTVNLYVYLEAAAWAPLVVLALARATASGSGRAVAGAALALAVALSTTGVEIVAQAVVIGLLLGLRRPGTQRLRGLAGAGAALGLGTLLAAPVLLLVAAQVGDSARSQGFATDVVLAHSVHPFTLLQTLVGGLYGNLSNLAGEWWGQKFFPRGFPYILSLYVGAAALAVATLGSTTRHPLRGRLLLLFAAGLVVSVGRWAGLGAVVEILPGVNAFRYPVKAFFTAHTAFALLVALGLSELAAADSRRRWARLTLAAGALGGGLVLAPLLPRLLPAAAEGFAAAFFPPGFDPRTRAVLLARVLADAAAGGAMALAAAAVAGLAFRGTVRPARATLLVVAVIVADLLRAGAGLNPMVTGSFFRPSPELESRLPALREGRVFTCSFDESRSYHEARRAKGTRHEVWTFAVALETLTPAFNVPLGVPTAMSPDLTMLVPEDRVTPSPDAGCRDLDAIVPRLRHAGVDTVVSTDPLVHPALEPRGVLAPERLAPLRVHLYRVSSPLPRLHVAAGNVVRQEVGTDRLEIEVEADSPSALVVRDGWAPGWTAQVNGAPAPVRRANGRHRAVAVPAGRSVVVMQYQPPERPASLGVSAFALAALVGLLWRRRPGTEPGTPPTA